MSDDSRKLTRAMSQPDGLRRVLLERRGWQYSAFSAWARVLSGEMGLDILSGIFGGRGEKGVVSLSM